MIFSTTLTGNCQDIIADALKSALPQVDKCLVIDTGATDDTLRVAKDVCGEKFVLRRFRWRDDFSAARNFALREAESLGAKWAMTLDTDERLLFEPGFDLRKRLSEFDGTLLLVQQADGTYFKERIFRLPTGLRFHGVTHEALRGVNRASKLRGMSFFELAKNPEQFRAKNERDVALLREYIKFEDAPRWHFHLGTALHGLKRYEEAIDAYRKCALKRGWPEEAAWACYMAGECFCRLGRYIEAIEVCAHGWNIRPQTAELAWLAGYAAYQARELESAIAWATIAIKTPQDHSRISFQYPYGQLEGPYEILYFAHQALGHEAEAEHARQNWLELKQRRLENEGAGPEGSGATGPGTGSDQQALP